MCCKFLGELQDYWVELYMLISTSKHSLSITSRDKDTPITLLLPSSCVATRTQVAGPCRAKGINSIPLASTLGERKCILFHQFTLKGPWGALKLGVVLKELLPARTSLSSCFGEANLLRSVERAVLSHIFCFLLHYLQSTPNNDTSGVNPLEVILFMKQVPFNIFLLGGHAVAIAIRDRRVEPERNVENVIVKLGGLATSTPMDSAAR